MNHEKKIAVGTSKGTIVLLNVNYYLDPMREDQPLSTFSKVHEQSINSMRLNRTGNWLLTGEKNGIVKFFNTQILYENQEVPKAVILALSRLMGIQRNTKILSETLLFLLQMKSLSHVVMIRPFGLQTLTLGNTRKY